MIVGSGKQMSTIGDEMFVRHCGTCVPLSRTAVPLCGMSVPQCRTEKQCVCVAFSSLAKPKREAMFAEKYRPFMGKNSRE